MAPAARQSSSPRRFQAESVVFHGLEESERALAAAFYSHSMVLTSPDRDFNGRLTLQRLGPIVVGELDYNTGALVTCPDIEDSYHLNVPVAGAMASESRGREVRLTSDRAALYRKRSDALLDSEQALHMRAVKFDGRALERALSALLGRPVDVDLELAADLHLGHGLAKQWWELLNSVCAQLDRGDALLQSALVAEPLAQALMTGFLLAADHQFSEMLHTDVETAAPTSVRLAADLILAHLAEPISMAAVAHDVGFSVRAIQRGFVQHLGVTPSQYIRAQRLRRAHADLIAGDPSSMLVTDVAARWGFGHLGRFAGQYRDMFGTSPSETLRS